jgi:hypothetical protein
VGGNSIDSRGNARKAYNRVKRNQRVGWMRIMTEVNVKDGKAYCEKCDKDVSATEKKRREEARVDTGTATRALILVGECGHVIAERIAPDAPWEKYAA